MLKEDAEAFNRGGLGGVGGRGIGGGSTATLGAESSSSDDVYSSDDDAAPASAIGTGSATPTAERGGGIGGVLAGSGRGVADSICIF